MNTTHFPEIHSADSYIIKSRSFYLQVHGSFDVFSLAPLFFFSFLSFISRIDFYFNLLPEWFFFFCFLEIFERIFVLSFAN